MKIDIYQSSVNSGAFISVRAGTNLNDISVSEDEIKTFGKVYEFKKALSINAGDKRIALNSEHVIKDIEKGKTEVIETKPFETSNVKIEDAEIIVRCGRGIEKKEDTKILKEVQDRREDELEILITNCQEVKQIIHYLNNQYNYFK